MCSECVARTYSRIATAADQAFGLPCTWRSKYTSIHVSLSMSVDAEVSMHRHVRTYVTYAQAKWGSACLEPLRVEVLDTGSDPPGGRRTVHRGQPAPCTAASRNPSEYIASPLYLICERHRPSDKGVLTVQSSHSCNDPPLCYFTSLFVIIFIPVDLRSRVHARAEIPYHQSNNTIRNSRQPTKWDHVRGQCLSYMQSPPVFGPMRFLASA